MRLSISGSFSTGKTTLASSLYTLLTTDHSFDVALIKEVARKVIAKGFHLDREATLGSYLIYITEQLAAEYKARQHTHVLSDRSLIDLLAYVRVNADNEIPECFNRMLEEIVRLETQYFDCYCYLPIEFMPISDGIRCIDPEYQNQIDKELANIFQEFNVPLIRISGEHTARIRQAMTIWNKSITEGPKAKLRN